MTDQDFKTATFASSLNIKADFDRWGLHYQYLGTCNKCGCAIHKVTMIENPHNIPFKPYQTECDCFDAKHEEERKRHSIEISRVVDDINISYDQKNSGLDETLINIAKVRFSKNESNEEAYEFFMDYTHKFTKNVTKGIFVAGTTGVGKTTLAVKCAYRLMTKGFKVKFITAQALYDEIAASYSFDRMKKSLDEIKNDFVSYDLVVIDDLGREKKTEDARDKIMQFIDLRGNRKPTIITTNLSGSDIGNWYHAPLMSRIKEYYYCLAIGGKDHRTIEQKKLLNDYKREGILK